MYSGWYEVRLHGIVSIANDAVQALASSLFRKTHGIELNFYLTNFSAYQWMCVFHVFLMFDPEPFPHGSKVFLESKLRRKIFVGASFFGTRVLFQHKHRKE
jgi:hypothetical protein